MERIVLIVLVAFILIWTYNLFIDNFIPLEEVEEDPYKGIIRIYDFAREGSLRWLQDKIRSFEKRNPGVYVEIVSPSEEDEIPDIVPIDFNSPNLDILVPLDDYFEKQGLNNFRQQALKPLMHKKELMAVPIAMSTNAIYINIDKFNEKGVSLPYSGSWTYEEFVDSLKRLTYSSEGEGPVDNYGFLASMDPEDYSIWGIILSDGARLVDPKRLEYKFYGEKALSGLGKLVDLKYKYGIVPDYFGIIGKDHAWEMFFQEEKVAAFATGAWALDKLDKAHREGEGFNFDLVSFPIGKEGSPRILSNDIIAYGITKDEDLRKIEMCVRFLKHLTSNSNQKSLEEIRMFSVKENIDDMYMDDLKMKKLEEYLDYTHYIPIVGGWEEIVAIFHREITRALLGQKPFYEAVEDAKVKIDRLKD